MKKINQEFDLQAFVKETYKDRIIIRIINPKQAYYYMSQNVFPLWVEPGFDERIVFVFLKKDTVLLFKKWKAYDTGWKIR